MKNKKKIIAIAAVAVVLVACIVAAIFVFVLNDAKEPSLQEIVENRADSYKTDFEDSIAQMESQTSVTKYLVNWAENKGIHVTTDYNGNVIYSFKASEGFESRKPSVIICGYDYSCIENYINSIVCALTLARDETPRGEYTIIFVSEENGNKDAGHNISKDYLEGAAEVFYLGNDTSSRIVNASAGITEYKFTTAIEKTEPSYNKAYKISISGLPSEPITNKSVSRPNAVKMLGNLLATFKSKSVLFDLVEFTGGDNTSLTPGSASITIVVSDDAASKVETRLENAVESFTDKYSDKYPEAVYTYEVVEMPTEVIASDVTENLISLLYTVPSGVYFTDDDDNDTAYSAITSINAANDSAVITAVTSGYDETKTTELADTYQTICALTSFGFEQISSHPAYLMNENSKSLAEAFTNSYSEYKATTLKVSGMSQYTLCSAIAEDYPEINLVALGVTDRTKDNFAGGLIVHLGKLPQ